MALRWALFDLNGTLLDPSGIGEPLGLPAAESLAAFDEAVLLAMAETLAGSYRPFPDLLRAALERRAGTGTDGLDEALKLAARMPAYPDAGPAIERLRATGLEVGVLTNSATDAAERALELAGLREGLALVVGSDQVQAFKPDRRVYRLGVECTHVEPEEICMVAAHAWDLIGASAIGMKTAWVARKERLLPESVLEPDVRGSTLEDVAEGLARLAESV